MISIAAFSCFFNHHFLIIKPELLGEMADSTLGQKKDKMSREHLVVPENEEMLRSKGETTEGQGLQFKGDPTVKTGAD